MDVLKARSKTECKRIEKETWTERVRERKRERDSVFEWPNCASLPHVVKYCFLTYFTQIEINNSN